MGSTLQLGVTRDGHSREVSVTLSPEKLASVDGGQLDARLNGVRFSDLSDDQRAQGFSGVVISRVQPGSRAAAAGLTGDSVLIGVGNLRITSVAMLRGLAKVHLTQLVLVVADGEGGHYVVIN
jgi:serine protease Do/serine protease DegQ